MQHWHYASFNADSLWSPEEDDFDAQTLNLLFCFVSTIRGGHMQAYCVKCRAKKEMKDAKSITMKNGKPATQGVCPTCGTKMFKIGKS
jgi:NAD-dependent SIR2 family protein deacetylase